MKSPIGLQQIMVGLFGWHWYHRRFGGDFSKLVDEVNDRQYWSIDQFNKYQEATLGELLSAARRSTFYNDLFNHLEIKPHDPPFEALQKIPFLTKQDLRIRARDLLTQNPVPRDSEVFKSSGTTGTPTEIFYTKKFHQLVQAFFEARNKYWAGVTYRDRRVMFGVRKVCAYNQTSAPFWRFSPAENMAYCSIYHLSPKFMPSYVEFLNTYKPRLIMGYPSSLYVLARFILENDLEVVSPKAIITTSETVTDTIRESLECAWNCKVYDNYCAVEACMLATQCEYGSYHLSPDFGIFEIVDENGFPSPPGQIGKAVCTGLHNRLQPLIRYEIGDAVAWSEHHGCKCGRSMPILRGIEGRVEDFCVTSDGRKVLRFDTVFKGVHTIREAQVIQESADLFVINISPTQEFSDKDRWTILKNMHQHIGDARVEVVCVDEIPRSISGKFRPVISRINPLEN